MNPAGNRKSLMIQQGSIYIYICLHFAERRTSPRSNNLLLDGGSPFHVSNDFQLSKQRFPAASESDVMQFVDGSYRGCEPPSRMMIPRNLQQDPLNGP